MEFFMENIYLPNFYTHTVNSNQNAFLNIHQIGRDISSPGFSYPQYHNSYTVSIVKKGKGTLETLGKKYNLSVNDAFLTLPNELSVQNTDYDEPWELCFFSFSGSLVPQLLEKTVFKNGTVVVNMKNGDLAQDIINATILLNSQSHSDFLLFEYFFKFLSHIDIHKAFPLNETNNGQQKYVGEIKKYIQAHYLEPIKISEIANQLNINRSHLYRIFKKEEGVGVEDYIINIRMNHAKILLKDTTLTVSAVSTLVGYKNYATFLKRFKFATGITPLEYRNNNT